MIKKREKTWCNKGHNEGTKCIAEHWEGATESFNLQDIDSTLFSSEESEQQNITASKLEINNLLREGLRACRCRKWKHLKARGVYFILLYSAQQVASKAPIG